jgi:hypothetical protein
MTGGVDEGKSGHTMGNAILGCNDSHSGKLLRISVARYYQLRYS